MLTRKTTARISRNNDGEEVKIAGWVYHVRDLGKIVFVLIQDRDGIMQVVFREKLAEQARNLNLQDVIESDGIVRAIAPGTIKDDRIAQEFEILGSNLMVLSKAETPLPLPISDDLVLSTTGLDTRLDHRTLDLRREQVRAIFKVQESIVRAFREFLTANDFIEIHSPKVVATGTEGGTELFKVTYFEDIAYLAQSPQFYKQMLVGAGFERVFEVAPVFRAEPHKTVRHLNEYLSLDYEMGFIQSLDEVMDLENALLQYMFDKLSEAHEKIVTKQYNSTIPVVQNRIPKITFKEAFETLNKAEGDDLSPQDEKDICKYVVDAFDSEFVFVTHFPEGKRPFYTMPSLDRPGYTESFDLLLRGLEVTTGSQRIHSYELLIEKLEQYVGISKGFEYYLEPFKYAMPPHGGLAIGAERMTMQTLRLENIREACLFPRDKTRITP
ncbi:MAG: aspartate--tRNA(Asn) ligase [Candidatus Heimdallarchaeota archaeon]